MAYWGHSHSNHHRLQGVMQKENRPAFGARQPSLFFHKIRQLSVTVKVTNLMHIDLKTHVKRMEHIYLCRKDIDDIAL